MVTMVAGDTEGDDDCGKSNGNGDEGGGRATAMRTKATKMRVMVVVTGVVCDKVVRT